MLGAAVAELSSLVAWGYREAEEQRPGAVLGVRCEVCTHTVLGKGVRQKLSMQLSLLVIAHSAWCSWGKVYQQPTTSRTDQKNAVTPLEKRDPVPHLQT